MDILIRKATTADLDLVTHIEATCFPPAEAAPREAAIHLLVSSMVL